MNRALKSNTFSVNMFVNLFVLSKLVIMIKVFSRRLPNLEIVII